MGVVNQSEDLLTRIKRLEQQVKDMRRGTLSNAVISQGSLEVHTASGQVLFRAGEIPWGGSTVSGIAGYRANGSTAFVVWDTASGGGYFAFLDEQSNIIFSNDTVSQQGLATPYIPIHVMPYSQLLSPQQTTTSGSFDNLHRCHVRKQHPILQTLLLVQSDAGTTGEVQLVDSSTAAVISPVVPIAASTNAYTWLEAPLPGTHLEPKYIDVQARRTGGAGSIRVAVTLAIGKQS